MFACLVCGNHPQGLFERGRGVRKHYFGVDGVRFFAALSVCMFHLAFYSWASQYSSMAPVFQHAATFEPLVPFVWFGWVGVQIFFIVSGFVIASSASGASPGGFFQNRFLRLMPAAWVCATITLVALIASGVPFNRDLAERYLRSVSLWFSGAWVDGVYWTLAIEIMFYALVFGLLVWRKFHRLNLLAWGLACISWIFLLFRYLGPLSDLPAMKWLIDLAEILPMKHGVYFALGIWLWMWANNRLPRLSAAGALVSVGFGFFEIGARAMEVQVEASAASGQPILLPMLVWAAALAVIVIDARRPQTFAPSSKAARSIIILLGKTTYPLYLVHSVTGAAFIHFLVVKGVAPYLALLISISTMVALAMAIAAFLEPRLRSVTGRALKKIGTLFTGGFAVPAKPPAAPPGL